MSDDDNKMELNGIGQQFQPSNETQSDTEWATFRLRTGLNDDCLLKVMEFLNLDDLVNMCKTDIYFKDLITKWIIGKKFLNLRGMTQSWKNEIFEKFGKSMKKFVSFETNFNNYLETVIRHCTPGRLTAVELNLKEATIDNVSNVPLSMPFFSNLRSFKLNVLRFQRYSNFEVFLSALVVSALKIEYLQLFHVDIEGEWLRTNRMENICELRILKPCVFSTSDIKIFLRTLPKLEVFIYKGDEDISEIGSTLVECCPNLKTFHDIHTAHPHRRFSLGGITRYNFLTSFSDLNSIVLTAYTSCGCDLYYPLVKLATRKIVTLKIFSNLEHAIAFNDTDKNHIMNSSFANFLSLQELEFDIRNYRLEGELRSEFLIYFATQLKNLNKFTLQSSRLANAHKIIELLPKVRIFSISQVTFKHLPVEMRKIVRCLRSIRQTDDFDDESKVLQLIVNMEQWRELQVYKDIDKLAETVIDPFVEPYNHIRRCPSEIEV